MASATSNTQAGVHLSFAELLEHSQYARIVEALNVLIGSDDPVLHDPAHPWVNRLAQVLESFDHLTHLTVTLPRIIPSPSNPDATPTIITLSTAADLWTKLKQLQELRIVAAMDSESAAPPNLPPGLKGLTFIATAAEASTTAAAGDGAYQLHCPELQAAESSLSHGSLATLCASGSYLDGRKVVDDITALVYDGVVIPQKKPRPMPEYLTPKELEDRLSPPGLARRTKRALTALLGGFRAPGTERPGRTRKEKAQLREFDYKGGPGWSKSALTERVLWRR